jgi:N-acetylneuraminic acid mutarotase
MCAISKGNKVYFSGGMRKSVISTTLDILDISSGSWQTSRLLEPRSGHTAAVIDDNVYWVGGMTSSPVSANMASCSVEIMNTGTMEKTTTYLFTPSSPGTAMSYKGYLVVYSGWTSHLDIYNPVTKEWVVGEIPEKILAAAIVATPQGIFIAGGLSDQSVSSKQSEIIWKINF